MNWKPIAEYRRGVDPQVVLVAQPGALGTTVYAVARTKHDDWREVGVTGLIGEHLEPTHWCVLEAPG